MSAMISSSIDFRFVLTSVLFYVLLTLYEYSVCNNGNSKGDTCGASEFFTRVFNKIVTTCVPSATFQPFVTISNAKLSVLRQFFRIAIMAFLLLIC